MAVEANLEGVERLGVDETIRSLPFIEDPGGFIVPVDVEVAPLLYIVP